MYKTKARNSVQAQPAQKSTARAVLFWRGESIKKGSGKRNVFFLSEHITPEKAKKQHLNCKVQNFFTNLRKVLLWKNWFGCVMIENIRSIERGNGHEFSAEKGKAAQHALGRKPTAECNRNCKGIWGQPPDYRRGCGTSAGSRREHRGDPTGICLLYTSPSPRGYVLQKERSSHTKTIACRHNDDNLLKELYIVVDNGCAVLDVTVEHPVYGQILGQLQIFSRYDADQFAKKLGENSAPPLCALTNGVHLHTIQYQHEDDFHRVMEQLEKEGILFVES